MHILLTNELDLKEKRGKKITTPKVSINTSSHFVKFFSIKSCRLQKTTVSPWSKKCRMRFCFQLWPVKKLPRLKSVCFFFPLVAGVTCRSWANTGASQKSLSSLNMSALQILTYLVLCDILTLRESAFLNNK